MRNLLTWGLLFGSFVLVASCAKDEETMSVAPEIRGGRGESCLARNDCNAGLACVNNVCSQNDFDVAVSAKSCVLIECEKPEDCCTAPASSFCETWKQECEAGDTFSCSEFESSCTCQFNCEQNECVPSRKCTTDSNCLGSARRCVAEKCVECAEDADCGFSSDGAKCVANRCQSGCKSNEDCPIFHACADGACVETGCTTDRECVFALKNQLAKCADKKCKVPCEVDAECPSLNACDNGSCVFIGCETNEECRAFLTGEGRIGKSRAICR